MSGVVQAQVVRSWDAASGLAENHVSYMEADGDEIWLSHGRNWPLSVLDGFKTRQVQLPPGSEEVFQVGFSDLWVLHPQGLLYRDRDQASESPSPWRRIPIPQVASATVDERLNMRILAVSKARAWLLAKRTLLVVDGESRTATSILDAQAADLPKLYSMAADVDRERVWLGLAGAVAVLPRDSRNDDAAKLELYPLPSGISGRIRWLSPGRPGEVFAVVISPESTSRTALRFADGAWQVLRTTRAVSLSAWRSSSDEIWVQDGPRLESLGEDGRTTFFSIPIDREVVDVHNAPDGAIWLGTTKGLFRVSRGLWAAERDPLLWKKPALSGAPGPDGAVYFASDRALWRLQDGAWTAYPFPAGHETYPFLSNSTVPLGDGSVLVRPRHPAALLRWDPRTGRFSELRHPHDRLFRAVQPGPDYTAWINTSDRDDRFAQTLETFDGDAWTTVLDRGVDWGVGRFKSIFLERDGSGSDDVLWIGGAAGLSRYAGGEYQLFNDEGGGAFSGAYSVYRDQAGRLLVGGRTGIRELRDGRWRPVNESLGKIRSIVEDRSGRLWAAGDTGVHFEQDGRWVSLDEREGLPSKLASALVLDAYRRLWVATDHGLARYYDEEDRTAPQVRLDASYEVSDFAPSQPVRFRFQAFDRWQQTLDDRVLFSFRLDDEDWTPQRTEPTFYRDRLEPGEHRLEARAIDRNGNVGLTATPIVFAVALPWYMTWPFLLTAGVGIALVVILSGALTHSFRRKTRLVEELASRDQVLEQQVAERTEQLAQERDRANEAARLKSEFLANMSHEIRTPMNVVIGMTELVLSNDPEHKDRRYLKMVLSSAEDLLTIINDILDFSKIEAGKLQIEATPFPLGETLAEVHHAFLDRAQEKSIDLRLDLSSGIIDTVVGDPTRLRQVLINLVGNAIKFTERGYVEIAARTVASSETHHEVEFRVSDSGIGIPEARQALIFEAFAQADGSTTRRFGGTGLGLAICRQLVSLMDGTMKLESTQGRGSTFSFTVRFARADQAAAEPSVESLAKLGSATAAEEDQSEGRDALLVEDMPANQELAVALLERIGYRVRIASNGLEALDEWEKRRPDVILMDVQMPEMGGLEATRILREREAAHPDHTPIIALTAHAVKGDRERCLEAGMDDYLTKPIRSGDLHAALERAARADPPLRDN